MRSLDLELLQEVGKWFQKYTGVDDFTFGIPLKEKQAALGKIEQKITNLIELAKSKLPDRNESPCDLALIQYWEGRLRFCTGDGQAKELLIAAVKLDPSIVQGWITLGEVFMQQLKFHEAKSCFEKANEQNETKLALTHLAKLYRSNRLSTEGKAMHENLLKSIEIAKHALKLDITDGSLWFSLGNSYVQYFMVVSKDTADMQQALKAYANAKNSEHNSFEKVPDLHFNIATVQRFLQNYNEAIESLRRAVTLADAKVDAQRTLDLLIGEIRLIDKLTRNKCNLKHKKLARYVHALKNSPPPLAANFRNKSRSVTFKELKVGKNPNTHLICKKIRILTKCAFMCIDREGTVFSISILDVKFQIPGYPMGVDVIVVNCCKSFVHLDRKFIKADYAFLQVFNTDNLNIKRKK